MTLDLDPSAVAGSHANGVMEDGQPDCDPYMSRTTVTSILESACGMPKRLAHEVPYRRVSTLMKLVSDIPVVTVESIPPGASLAVIFESLTVPPEFRSILKSNRLGDGFVDVAPGWRTPRRLPGP